MAWRGKRPFLPRAGPVVIMDESPGACAPVSRGTNPQPLAMNPLDSLTVCVTTHGDQPRLERALESLRNAGIRRVTVAAAVPSDSTMEMMRRYAFGPFLSFDYVVLEQDPGCNSTWLAALYLARTERVIVLHHDDALHPDFGPHYCGVIAPILNSGKARWATWQGDHLKDDGTRSPCAFWGRRSGVYPASDLLEIVGRFGRLSLSPIVSVLDRGTCIDACKEAEQTLTANACYLHPGMLLGTEILVYLRHIAAFKNWFYLDVALSLYGHHPGSGTVKAETSKRLKTLCDGYDLARLQGAKRPPNPTPKIVLAWTDYATKSEDEERRRHAAMESWQWHFGTGNVIPLPIHPGDDRVRENEEAIPYVKDLLDVACEAARPQDVVVYINADIGLVVDAPRLIVEGMARYYGEDRYLYLDALALPRRNIAHPEPGRLMSHLRGHPTDGGFDAFAMRPEWWHEHRALMPDMLIGREGWDTVLRVLMHEDATGERITSGSVIHDFASSPACLDGVLWHAPHESPWKQARYTSSGNAHNRGLLGKFLEARGLNLAAVPGGDLLPVE